MIATSLFIPGQADLDPAGTRPVIVLDRPAQQALADPDFAALRCARQLSSATTHISNGTSTIRRNDSNAGTGGMSTLMLAHQPG